MKDLFDKETREQYLAPFQSAYDVLDDFMSSSMIVGYRYEYMPLEVLRSWFWRVARSIERNDIAIPLLMDFVDLDILMQLSSVTRNRPAYHWFLKVICAAQKAQDTAELILDAAARRYTPQRGYKTLVATQDANASDNA